MLHANFARILAFIRFWSRRADTFCVRFGLCLWFVWAYLVLQWMGLIYELAEPRAVWGTADCQFSLLLAATWMGSNASHAKRLIDSTLRYCAYAACVLPFKPLLLVERTCPSSLCSWLWWKMRHGHRLPSTHRPIPSHTLPLSLSLPLQTAGTDNDILSSLTLSFVWLVLHKPFFLNVFRYFLLVELVIVADVCYALY